MQVSVSLLQSVVLPFRIRRSKTPVLKAVKTDGDGNTVRIAGAQEAPDVLSFLKRQQSI